VEKPGPDGRGTLSRLTGTALSIGNSLSYATKAGASLDCWLILARLRPQATYSHSIVAGGLELMSYTTRLMPRISLIIRFET